MLAHPTRLIAIGFLLLVLGFVVIFAMVLRVLEPSFLLSFAAYGASFVGLVLGLLGIFNK
jgi:hypothetical protein